MADPLTSQQMAQIHAAAFTQSRPWSQTEFTALLDSPLVLACGDARAFALVRLVAGEAELLTLATHPAHQRQGLGRAVMQAWQSQAKLRGATESFLEVAADNAPALLLYESEGFAACGRRRGYYPRANGASVDAIVMQRGLR
ncbi:GNAT family N-acetyltransferase [Pseudophaeobacter flagellatus]|uniref:GNAT family N-acetyltransferase n=1 Tax=Pseudophaeobacter flagellatus TaxID=2899119 RepID=UPI001E54F49E|nr:GNAT family N-acetyltransferase [Pseudophaeobacter flagellatus]MCD9148271.1 GNAT family N-acetyltransferase [Pseudophaeobacter flagellatus]